MKGPSRRALVVLCCVCIELYLFISSSGFELSPKKNLGAGGPPCDREAIRNGLWLKKRTEDEDGNGDDYEWSVPNQRCSFQSRFHSDDFCRLMGNAVILVLGDSISFEQYASLVRLATNGTVISENLKARAQHKRGLPVIINVCGQSNVTLVYKMQIALTGNKWSNSMDDILTKMPPTSVILNTGAHFMGDNAFISTLEPAFNSLEKWQQSCMSRNNIPCPLFYRTTFPGIPHCMNFTAPENNRAKMEEHVATPDPGKEWNAYHWKEFNRQNGLVLDHLEYSSKLQYEIIDGYEMGLTRPDTRKTAADCLHNRIPAIADANNAAFLHHMKAILSEDDVATMRKLNHGFDRRQNVNEKFRDMNWELVDSTEYPYKYSNNP
ncbi:hypothetical protein THAOC_21288 [Thalassiosira oceanica]|uniref:SGNH domain-containing protein n=1 Tax=Thalassiosira oceanica TaxID=159749 RepID=K0RXP6_THAOC|nr:hypothetical protein THAOC_21288 [Thalassiosira oceanica]|eukprot:EJK58578.1 hypothetical protein THAOC_21288 [Thalassiosira oceanica]